MYKIKFMTAVCGAAFFLSTGCGSAPEYYPASQKQFFDNSAYESGLIDICPLPLSIQIEKVLKQLEGVGTNRYVTDILDSKNKVDFFNTVKDGFKGMLKANGFKNLLLESDGVYSVDNLIIKLGSEKPAGEGLRDTDLVMEKEENYKFVDPATTTPTKLGKTYKWVTYKVFIDELNKCRAYEIKNYDTTTIGSPHYGLTTAELDILAKDRYNDDYIKLLK